MHHKHPGITRSYSALILFLFLGHCFGLSCYLKSWGSCFEIFLNKSTEKSFQTWPQGSNYILRLACCFLFILFSVLFFPSLPHSVHGTLWKTQVPQHTVGSVSTEERSDGWWETALVLRLQRWFFPPPCHPSERTTHTETHRPIYLFKTHFFFIFSDSHLYPYLLNCI